MSDEFITKEHSIILKNRNSIVITGIKSVDSFDENSIEASIVDDCSLTVEGTELSIKDVNLDKNCLEAQGIITSIYYNESVKQKRQGLFSRLFDRK